MISSIFYVGVKDDGESYILRDLFMQTLYGSGHIQKKILIKFFWNLMPVWKTWKWTVSWLLKNSVAMFWQSCYFGYIFNINYPYYFSSICVSPNLISIPQTPFTVPLCRPRSHLVMNKKELAILLTG